MSSGATKELTHVATDPPKSLAHTLAILKDCLSTMLMGVVRYTPPLRTMAGPIAYSDCNEDHEHCGGCDEHQLLPEQRANLLASRLVAICRSRWASTPACALGRVMLSRVSISNADAECGDATKQMQTDSPQPCWCCLPLSANLDLGCELDME